MVMGRRMRRRREVVAFPLGETLDPAAPIPAHAPPQGMPAAAAAREETAADGAGDGNEAEPQNAKPPATDAALPATADTLASCMLFAPQDGRAKTAPTFAVFDVKTEPPATDTSADPPLPPPPATPTAPPAAAALAVNVAPSRSSWVAPVVAKPPPVPDGAAFRATKLCPDTTAPAPLSDTSHAQPPSPYVATLPSHVRLRTTIGRPVTAKPPPPAPAELPTNEHESKRPVGPATPAGSGAKTA